MAKPAAYSYSDAGFNGFFRRTIDSNPTRTTLGSNGPPSKALNFDDLQTSGAIGDKIKVGSITIDGKAGRISLFDANGNEVGRIGNLDD